ncbi:protein prune homolog 2 [Agrilus planipennis]|uniref:Protein prune homolog 2 n=1 Tax=Agrilus planipennis TaxID=224129 RepID=A0A1W4XDR1_AGRPL|nr:protein prune homolog 2 [Agrilus planipennis]
MDFSKTTVLSNFTEAQCTNEELLSDSQNTQLSLNVSTENKMASGEGIMKSVSVSKSANDFHPLMSPTSPISPDFPDLIPEKSRNRNVKQFFNPEVSSSPKEGAEHLENLYENHLNMDLPTLEEYFEKIPDFPDSPSVLKKSLLFDMPCEISNCDGSDTENDKSVYEAHLSENFQNVALKLNEKEGNLNFLAHTTRSHKLRKIRVTQSAAIESEVSSIDSDPDSLKSDDIFMEPEENNTTSRDSDTPFEPVEPLSADEERCHARHWQRMILPGGEQRTIDMRVIEPYKRVLSHGGYVRGSGNTAIVVFSACFLPDKSRIDYDYVMDNLFLYVLWTLERLVTDDYVMVYLHGGATRLPAFSWLKRCYQLVGRRLRKNLNHMYITHPTIWIKTMLFMAKPFISSKFYRKITFVGNLKELYNRLPIETNAVPDKVKAFDSLHCRT